jgi:hypothetical protein
VIITSAGIRRLPLPPGAPLTATGAVKFAWRRMNLSEALGSYDPGGRLNSALSDAGEGTGISIDLTGSWSTTDPLTGGVYIVWDARDIYGHAIEGGTPWVIEHLLVERTNPGNSTDYSVVGGFVNESTDSATIDGVFNGGIRHTGASMNVTCARIINGTSTLDNGATTDTALARVIWADQLMGTDGYTRHVNVALGLNSSSVRLANMSNGVGSITHIAFGTGQPYLVLAAYRSAATAGTALGKYDYYTRCWSMGGYPT